MRQKDGRHRNEPAHTSAIITLAAAAMAGILCVGETPAQEGLDLEVEAGNRRLSVTWPATAEVQDSLFGGYEVMRAQSSDAASFLLLRRFQRRYPVSWTFCPQPFPGCGPVAADTLRRYADDDSLVTFIKVQVSAQGDSAITRRYMNLPPHNGFPYYYAVTWFSECLTERNDTLWVYKPQPEIFEFQRGSETLNGFVDQDGDTLLVEPIDCRRIDRATNTPVGPVITVMRGTADHEPGGSETALRLYAIDQGKTAMPTFASSSTRSSLREVRPIPNPYEQSAAWDQPGERKIQFINLTDRATIRIFTVAGDLVRLIEHPSAGNEGRGSADWDLKNGDGRLVESGIYVYHVESPGDVDVQGRLVIVR